LDSYASAEALESVGVEVLKTELESRGMKSGGSVQQRAARLFLAKGVSDLSTLPAKLFAKKRSSAAATTNLLPNQPYYSKGKRKAQQGPQERGVPARLPGQKSLKPRAPRPPKRPRLAKADHLGPIF
jgi:hypothetical protein